MTTKVPGVMITPRITNAEDYGAAADGTTDDTVAIQAAIDALAALGGGRLLGASGKTYKITAALQIKTGVWIDGQQCKIKQHTNNTPIITAPSTGDIQTWGISNITLEFATQQTSADTSGVGIRLANTKNSYNWSIRNVQVNYACDGIFCPATTGTFAFVGEITNFIAYACAVWAANVSCDTANGANTNIVCTNLWALQPSGAEIATSKGFRFVATSMGQWNSLFADHIQNDFLYFESCSGVWGVLTLESADITAATVQIPLVTFADTSGVVDTLKFVANDITTSGGGEVYLLRPTASVAESLTIWNFVTSGNNYTGTGIYEVNPSSGMSVFNRRASLDRAVALVDAGVTKLVKEWNGVDRSVSRGTTAQRPTPAADAIGTLYLDNTLDADGKPIWWNGTAWVDATGATV